jgi:exodeoxyribonuclease-3
MIEIATWNINSVRLRIDQVERFLTQEKPDVLCLQEIKCAENLFPREMFERLGYGHMAVSGQRAITALPSSAACPCAKPAANWQANGEARHVGVEILGHDLFLDNVYIPAGGDVPDREANPKFGQKLDFLERMTRWSEGLDRDAAGRGFQHRPARMRRL